MSMSTGTCPGASAYAARITGLSLAPGQVRAASDTRRRELALGRSETSPTSRAPPPRLVHVARQRRARAPPRWARSLDQLPHVDAGLHAEPVQEVDEVLGRGVAGRAGRERATARGRRPTRRTCGCRAASPAITLTSAVPRVSCMWSAIFSRGMRAPSWPITSPDAGGRGHADRVAERDLVDAERPQPRRDLGRAHRDRRGPRTGSRTRSTGSRAPTGPSRAPRRRPARARRTTRRRPCRCSSG